MRIVIGSLSRNSEAATSLTNAFYPSPRMSEHELAQHWDKSVRTLQRWRGMRCGPAYFRIGQTIYYRTEDILAFEEAARKRGSAE
jgi:hypothetical protein